MDDLVKSYLAGESINKLMQRFYLSRKVIAGGLRKSWRTSYAAAPNLQI